MSKFYKGGNIFLTPALILSVFLIPLLADAQGVCNPPVGASCSVTPNSVQTNQPAAWTATGWDYTFGGYTGSGSPTGNCQANYSNPFTYSWTFSDGSSGYGNPVSRGSASAGTFS